MSETIDVLTAFLAVGDDGVEGIVAAHASGAYIPLVTGRAPLIPEMRRLAEAACADAGKQLIERTYARTDQ